MSQPAAFRSRPASAPSGSDTLSSAVSLGAILRFYLPLVLNSQMMTLSGPVINVAVGRAQDPKPELAGYWIGFTVLLFIESACLSTQSATAALARGYHSVRRIFITALAVSLTACVLVLLVAKTPLGDPLFDHVIRTTPRVESLARTILAFLTPVPLIIAMRGVANGIAIREKRTMLVARATSVRILAIAAVVGVTIALGTGSGARAGAAAFVTGVTLEAIVIWLGVWPHWRRRVAERATDLDSLGFGEIARVASPLVISALAWTSFRPLVNGILGRLADPELAQAGFGVVMPLLLLTCSPLWTLQNVSLMLPESRTDLGRVMRFGVATGTLFSVVILFLALSPVRDFFLRDVFALSPELEAAVAPALIFIALEPIVLSIRSMSQGLMMRARRTGAFAVFAPIKTALVLGVGYVVVRVDPGVNGTLLGTLLLIGADGFEAIVYGFSARRLVRSGLVFDEPPLSPRSRSGTPRPSGPRDW